MTDPETPADGSGGDDTPNEDNGSADSTPTDGISRRWLIRLIVGVGIGLPVLIELRTFVALVRSWLGIESEDRTPPPTPDEDAVGIGDEILPETPAVERLRSAKISDGAGDVWPFTVVLSVENSDDVPYAFSLGAVTTTGETVVDGGVGTERLAPGESTTVATTWSLPKGEQPRRMAVRGERFADGGSEVIERTVRLGSIPVQRE